ncbi:MAG: hypothetical protein HOH65_03190 [Rhodospirillaceae bacterium]|jgi:hypothetical protein|nr:hypothetical protein [Rhodospirillaceae bacterium]
MPVTTSNSIWKSIHERLDGAVAQAITELEGSPSDGGYLDELTHQWAGMRLMAEALDVVDEGDDL